MAKIEKFPKSLGVPRKQMPQIRSFHIDKFFGWLDQKGITTRCAQRKVGDLKPAQKEVNLDKAQDMLKDMSRASLKKRIVISRDLYILDGHHRWAALRIEDPRNTIDACKVNLKIRPLLRMARRFKDVGFAPIAGADMSRTGQWAVVLGILATAAVGSMLIARRRNP